jgi:hypothetical protein
VPASSAALLRSTSLLSRRSGIGKDCWELRATTALVTLFAVPKKYGDSIILREVIDDFVPWLTLLEI